MQIRRGEGVVLEDNALRRFRDDGFALLSDAVPPHELAAEIDAVFWEGSSEDPLRPGAGGVRFAFVPMMSEHTPTSTLLADALAGAAARALGRPVLPGRAKGTTYFGDSGWHCDSELDIPSVAFVAYLEPLRRGHGALEVLPRSHLGKSDTRERESIALETQPGDIVVFDEHVIHGSRGGDVRRQW